MSLEGQSIAGWSRPYSWITRSLAVGGCFAAEEVPFIAADGITHVVDLREEARDDEALLTAHGIGFLYLPTPDNTALTEERLRLGSAWVVEHLSAGQKVLVHCQYGIGRSALLSCAVLARLGYSADDALALVKAHRSVVAPNASQFAALQRFCASLDQSPRSADKEGTGAVSPTPARTIG